MRIRHIGIVVRDMESQKRFYTNVLGLTPFYDEVEKVRIVKLRDRDGIVIELLQYESMSETALRSKGISHISFTQDEEGNPVELVKENVA